MSDLPPTKYLDMAAKAYREGEYDADPEVQFALSMLKRDPAAMEAFRGVGK